jgi:hypothetical protein
MRGRCKIRQSVFLFTQAEANMSDPIHDLAPADFYDPVIESYKKDVDRTLLRENLKLTVEQRIRKALSFHKSIAGWRGSGDRTRRKEKS